MLDSPENRKFIVSLLPNLNGDLNWRISSPTDNTYNCIAWACIQDSIIYWPHDKPKDGVTWPYGLPLNAEVETFIELFKRLTYEICDNYDFEEGFQKVVIYYNEKTQLCTHAARMQLDGKWTSKLGPSFDISHSTPHSVEGDVYGIMKVIMKRKHSQFRAKNLEQSK